MRVGHLIPGANDDYDVFDLSSVMSRVEQLPDSEDKDILLNNLEYVSYPYLISLSGYNHVLELAGKNLLHCQTMRRQYLKVWNLHRIV